MSRKEKKQEKLKETKEKRKRHPLRTLVSLIAIFIACFLLWMAGDDLLMTFHLKQEISNNEQMITDLQDQKDGLAQQKTNLEDPDYVKRYARGKYMVSKPGEQVFKLPSKNADKE